MGLRNLNELIEHFWKGETSLEEEKRMKAEAEGNYFEYIREQQKTELSSDFDRKLISKIEGRSGNSFRGRFTYFLAAASVAFLIGFFVTKQNQNAKKAEAQLAYEQTKAALLLVSAKLNEGAEYTNELNKINEVKEIIATN